MGLLGDTVVKNLPANAEEAKDADSVPVLGRCPGEGNGNPLQLSCLENFTDRGAWQAMVHADVTEHAHHMSHNQTLLGSILRNLWQSNWTLFMLHQQQTSTN